MKIYMWNLSYPHVVNVEFLQKNFKKQVVDLHQSGKPRKEIISDYDLTASAFDKWAHLYSHYESFKDNLATDQKELRELQKKCSLSVGSSFLDEVLVE